MITILHVDDDEKELRLASKFLNQISDYLRIIQATSGDEALDIVRKTRIDCVIADYHMPLMDGMELYKEIRHINNLIPFILLTGRGNEKIASEAIKQGVDAYLIKGGDIYFYEEMLKTIRRLKDEKDQRDERERALRVLRESEKYLSEIQEVARIGYTVFNISTGYWNSSKITDEIFGIDEEYPKTLEGWLDLVEPDHRKKFLYHFQSDALGEKGKFDLEFPIKTRNSGTRRWIRNLGRVSFDPNGNPVSMIGTVQDITEKKEMEKRLKEAETFCKVFMETSNEPVFISDHAGKYVDVNDLACELTGYSREELLKMYVRELFDEQGMAAGREHFEQLLQEGSNEGVLDIVKKGGEPRKWLVKARRITETRYLAIVTDLTEEQD